MARHKNETSLKRLKRNMTMLVADVCSNSARTGITADKLPGDNTPKERSERKNYKKNCQLSVWVHCELCNERSFGPSRAVRSKLVRIYYYTFRPSKWRYTRHPNKCCNSATTFPNSNTYLRLAERQFNHAPSRSLYFKEKENCTKNNLSKTYEPKREFNVANRSNMLKRNNLLVE